VVGALLGLLLLFGGRLFNDVQQLLADATEHYQQIQAEWSQGTPFQQVIVQQLTPLSDLSQAIAGEQGMAFMQTLLGITLSSLDLLGQVIIILVLSIYWSSDQERFKRLWLSLFPAETRARMRASWQAIEDGVGAYVRSEFVQSSLALLLLALGYSVLGLKYPILLALTGAIGWLLPWVGVLLAVIPACLVGLLLSPGLALGAVAYSLTSVRVKRASSAVRRRDATMVFSADDNRQSDHTPG
jgi:predicted PurR-regulated permease PerM